MEINLLRQVVNQCAIALRQSRLYQAAQAQVTELERLNALSIVPIAFLTMTRGNMRVLG